MTVYCRTCGHEAMHIARRGTKLRDHRCGQCGGQFRRATAEEERRKRRRVFEGMTPVPGLNDRPAA